MSEEIEWLNAEIAEARATVERLGAELDALELIALRRKLAEARSYYSTDIARLNEANPTKPNPTQPEDHD